MIHFEGLWFDFMSMLWHRAHSWSESEEWIREGAIRTKFVTRSSIVFVKIVTRQKFCVLVRQNGRQLSGYAFALESKTENQSALRQAANRAAYVYEYHAYQGLASSSIR